MHVYMYIHAFTNVGSCMHVGTEGSVGSYIQWKIKIIIVFFLLVGWSRLRLDNSGEIFS